MPLSEHEQRMLEQIEQALYDEDPKFASSVRSNRVPKPNRRKRVTGAALFILGAVCLPAGVMLDGLRLAEVPWLSVLGFFLMFTGVLVAFVSRSPKAGSSGKKGTGKTDPGGQGKSGGSFSQRMEERFKHRFDDR